MQNTNLCLKSYQPYVNTHQHSFHQLVLPVNGALELEIGNTAGVVTLHSGAIISAAQNHAFQASEQNQFIVADIPIHLAPALTSIPAFIELDDTFKQYLIFVQQQLTTNNNQANACIQRQMLLLLIQLIEARHTQHHLLDKRVLQAKHYFEQYFYEKNVLANAAKHSYLSERHLRQLFTNTYAITPSQFILDKRMQAAWQLLTTTNKSVELIAQTCGYTSSSAFCRRFQQHFSTPASHVRRLGQ